MESYTIGRDYFGMEKEFIYEVVQNCPECRYYKSQMPSYHTLPETNGELNVPFCIDQKLIQYTNFEPSFHLFLPYNLDKSSKGLKDLMPNSQRQHQDYKSAARGIANTFSN